MTHTEQPLPTTGGQVGPGAHDLAIADLGPIRCATDRDTAAWLTSRKQIGLVRYRSLLLPFNGRSTPRDAVEEACDLLVYLRNLIAEGEPVNVEYSLVTDVLKRLVARYGPPVVGP